MLENLLGETGMAIATFVLIMACVFWAFAPFAVFRLNRQVSKISSEMTALVDELAALREALEGKSNKSAQIGQPTPEPSRFGGERHEPALGTPTRTTGGLRAERD